MSYTQTKLTTEEWITATWDEYIQVSENPQLEKAKCYYYNGQLRIEMTPQGYDHSYDNFSIGAAIALFSGFRIIPISAVTNCSFRKANEAEAQPDLDNVEHFPNLPNFPHHVHVGDESNVNPGKSLSILELIEIVEQKLSP